MQKILWSIACLLSVAVTSGSPLKAASPAEDDLSGFTMQQLNTTLVKSGLASQTIYSIQTFDIDDQLGRRIAILFGPHSGWRIALLHRTKGGLNVEWQSGKLPRDIAVSSPNDFEIGYLDDGEPIVKFSGCAPHDCGGVNGVIGLLLYATRTRQVFFAHYRYDDSKPIGNYGSLDFSDNADAPGNEKYKAALQSAMKQKLGK